MKSNQNPGLYIHVPFCAGKCAYCDFYSITRLDLVPQWLKTLKQEAIIYRDRFAPFDTFYLGGGTPSILSDKVLSELVDVVKKNLSFSAEIEMTIETNPDDLSLAKLKMFHKLGFNRLSLGVQSFDNDILKFLHRRHTAQHAIQSLDWARTAGFNNISIDLMYAIPNQNAKAWYENLQQALKFKPEHLSCYQLTLEPSTPLGQLAEQNRLQLWDEDNARLFFLETSLALAAAGYIHYEISNFAGDPDHFSRHNMKYWQHTPYLGLGPAAHSFLGKNRWWNIRDLDKYCKALDGGQTPLEESEELTQDQWQLETLYLGFRTNQGVDLELLKNYPNHGAVLKQLRESLLIHEQDGRIIPTREGFVVADSMPLMFG